MTTSGKPLLFRQGSVESTDYYQNKLYIGGDLGLIEIWEKTADHWRKTSSIAPQATQSVNMEAEALAIHPGNGHIYIGTGAAITVIDQKGKYISEIALQMTTKGDRLASEYMIAGMDFYQDFLYVL